VRTALRVEAGSDPGDLRRTAAMLLELGPAVVMLTAGAAGLHLSTGPAARLEAVSGERAREWSGREHFTPPSPGAVRTTLGAGDAATAGLLYGLLTGRDPRDALELAARTAAARVAGEPPALKE